MCVLTYIPTHNKDFILTSNRDEATLRSSAIPPKKYDLYGNAVFYPKDPQGGGTWIASNGDYTLCLLNGGYIKHIPKPPYKHSRGLVILDFFKYLSVEAFFSNYDFENIEPFTLVIIDRTNQIILHEIRWTGVEKHIEILNASNAKIWSSATLYPIEIIAKREKWFNDFIVKNEENVIENILKFHHFGGDGDIRNDIKMNRDNELKTVSISQFVVNQDDFLINYEDLQKNQIYNFRVFMEKV
jgi:uncharacterized protein with NRDE domain